MKHNRQYILSKIPYLIDSSWSSLRLRNGYTLSFQKNLRVQPNDDESVVLLGDAWQVDPVRKTPFEILRQWNSNTPLEEIYEQEESWSGRYIIITNRYVLTDTTSQLACFYTDHAVSSSIALLQYTLGEETLVLPPKEMLIQGKTMPGPLTPHRKIRRLLCSQVLDYQEFTTVAGGGGRSMLFGMPRNTGHNLEDFEKAFFYSIEQMYKHYENYEVWFGLSGGKDSRTGLAALEKLKKDYHLYVFRDKHSQYAGCYADYALARLLSKKVHKKLLVIHRNINAYNSKRAQEFEEHTAGMIANITSKWMYNEDSLRPIRQHANHILLIRNNIWEIVSDFYAGRINTSNQLRAEWKGMGMIVEESIEEWLRMVAEDKLNTSLSLSERAYWELRDGCWCSDGLQSMDIFDSIEMVNILNCRRFLRLLMGLDLETRRKRLYQITLTNQWCPDFADIPYGNQYIDVYILLERLFRKVKKWLKIL